jgi:ABC-type Mn2+/Zn2+ transport system ATPase subunit
LVPERFKSVDHTTEDDITAYINKKEDPVETVVTAQHLGLAPQMESPGKLTLLNRTIGVPGIDHQNEPEKE